MELLPIQQKIYEVRGVKIMLDFDLAELFGIETRVFNQSIKRNETRFPKDFMFRLTTEEWQVLIGENAETSNSSQIVMSSRKHRGKAYLPLAFTEHGVTMLASVMKSERAIEMNIAIVRAFIAMREMAMHYKDLAEKIAAMEEQYDKQFSSVYEALKFLMERKEQEVDWESRNRIGFKKS